MRKDSETDELMLTGIPLSCKLTISVSFVQFTRFVRSAQIADGSASKEEPGFENAGSVTKTMSGSV